MKPWICEGVAKDGGQHSNQNPPGPHEPYENYGEDCVICNLTREQVVGGVKKGESSFPAKGLAALGLAVLAVLAAGWFFFLRGSDPDPVPVTINQDTEGGSEPIDGPSGSEAVDLTPEATGLRQDLYAWQPDRFTWGQQTFFSGDANVPRDEGIESFRAGDYAAAASSFDRAVSGNRNDPEVLIFHNNARAQQQGSPYTLAVVVPVEGRSKSAEEMLRGVAQAQNQFNEAGGLDGRLLEIVVANDGNDAENAVRVAEEIAADDSVLGVIGHNSSDASRAALEVYERAGLPMISPTSTSTELESDFFFRTVPSDAAAARELAQYAQSQGLSKVVIFYNPESSFSNSLKSAFENSFSEGGGESISKDMTDSELDAGIEVFRAASEDGAEALLLFPSTNYTRVAIELARANSKLSEGERLSLFGGDSLYSIDTVVAGGEATEGLVLPVPWFAGAPQFKTFSDASVQRWGGPVSWRTAMSFDAAQALIESLSSSATKADVLDNLRQINLPSEETSGQAFGFAESGDRESEPVLVQIVRGSANTVPGSEFGFELVSD